MPARSALFSAGGRGFHSWLTTQKLKCDTKRHLRKTWGSISLKHQVETMSLLDLTQQHNVLRISWPNLVLQDLTVPPKSPPPCPASRGSLGAAPHLTWLLVTPCLAAMTATGEVSAETNRLKKWLQGVTSLFYRHEPGGTPKCIHTIGDITHVSELRVNTCFYSWDYLCLFCMGLGCRTEISRWGAMWLVSREFYRFIVFPSFT